VFAMKERRTGELCDINTLQVVYTACSPLTGEQHLSSPLTPREKVANGERKIGVSADQRRQAFLWRTC
jgi:hypothetical protein